MEKPKKFVFLGSLYFLDEEKHAAEIKATKQNNFLGAMAEIFKHSGLGGKN